MERYPLVILKTKTKMIPLLESSERFHDQGQHLGLICYGERDSGQLLKGGVLANHVCDYLAKEDIYQYNDYPNGFYLPSWNRESHDFDGEILSSKGNRYLTIEEFASLSDSSPCDNKLEDDIF